MNMLFSNLLFFIYYFCFVFFAVDSNGLNIMSQIAKSDRQ